MSGLTEKNRSLWREVGSESRGEMLRERIDTTEL